MVQKKVHRPFGVYGVVLKDNKLLVIKKQGGPYNNRFDLPGGSLKINEDLNKALIRELKEETGYCVKNEGSIGICDFILPWSWDNSDYTHHICAFYHITIQSGTLDLNPEQFTGQDSKGAFWIKMDDFNVGNSSPLVLKVVEYFTKKSFDFKSVYCKDWVVKN